MINLIMPMGGAGSRFYKEGVDIPKPLIEIHDKPFFYWATQSIYRFVPVSQLIFVVLQEHISKYQIDEKISQYYPNAQFVALESILNGPVLTSLEGCKAINNDLPIVFNDCDHMFLAPEFYNFCIQENKTLDGALLTFKSQDPKFSYLNYDGNGYVTETVEKQVISNDAICGAYYFKNKETFTNAASEYLNHCIYPEFFMSGVYNMMSDKGLKSKGFPVKCHIAFGTPIEYQQAQNHIHQFLELL